ncbi:MAG: tetratricopeptide repeat protein [Rubripirellula sp.]
MQEPVERTPTRPPDSDQTLPLESASNGEPSINPTQLLEQATLAMQAGDGDAAYALARQAVRLAPHDPQAVFLMARMLGERHRFPEAIQMLDELAQTTPATRLPATGQTADWMVRFGRWSEAEERYLVLLKEVPDAALVHRNLARLLIRQGRRAEASKHLDRLCQLGDVEEIELRQMLLALHPFAGDASNEEFDPIGPRGIASFEIGRGDWESARKTLEAIETIEPHALGLLGRVYVNLNDFAALDRWTETASQSNESDANTWFAKGALAAKQGDHASAVGCFAESVLRDPTDRHAYALMSQSLEQLDAAKESAEVAARAKLIEQTQDLGTKMAETTDRDDAELATLIELLDQLRRPMEAWGWHGVRLAYGRSRASLSGAAEQEVLPQIARDRPEPSIGNDELATRQFLLCGVDPSRFSVKKRDHTATDSQP